MLCVCAGEPALQGYCGTLHYSPPEVLVAKWAPGGGQDVPMTSQILTWSIGMAMRCLLGGGVPKSGVDAYIAEVSSGSIRQVRVPTHPLYACGTPGPGPTTCELAADLL